jgi:hypothetical protein
MKGSAPRFGRMKITFKPTGGTAKSTFKKVTIKVKKR